MKVMLRFFVSARVMLSVVFLGCVFFPGALARPLQQSDPEDRETPPQPPGPHETITVQARPLPSPGLVVTVLERAEIEDSGAHSIADLLRSVSGVHILSSGSRGGFSTAQIRGGDPNFALVLLDGIPLNDPTDQFGGVYNLEGVSAAAIERVEVVRGPLSTLYGSQALAGVIYLSTRRGRGKDSSFEAEVEGGNAGYGRADISLFGECGAADYFVGGGWEREEGRIADESFRDAHLQGSLGWRFGWGSELRLSSRFADRRNDDYPEASGGPIFGSGELRVSTNREFTFSSNLAFQSAGRFEHGVTFGYFRHDLEQTSPAVGFEVPPSAVDITLDRLRLGWNGGLKLNDPAVFRFGVDLDREDASNRSAFFLPPAFGGEIDGSYEAERDTIGGFAEISLRIGRFQQDVGLRIDSPTDSDLVWSPRASASYWLPGQRTRLQASVGRAFKLPSFFAISTPRAIGGNPNLIPETAWGLDFGFEHHLPGARLTLASNYFYNRFRNLIDFDFEQFLNVNRSSVRTQGVELSAAWEIDSRVTIQGDYTLVDYEDLTSGIPLLQRPRHTGGVSLKLNPVRPLRIVLRARYTGEYFDSQIPVPHRNLVAGYGLAHLNASYQFSEAWLVRLQVENLTDHSYETLIGFPGPGVAARLSLRYRLR